MIICDTIDYLSMTIWITLQTKGPKKAGHRYSMRRPWLRLPCQMVEQLPKCLEQIICYLSVYGMMSRRSVLNVVPDLSVAASKGARSLSSI